MVKVKHFKKDCISCGACAAISPEQWKMDDEGIAQCISASENGDFWEKEIVSDGEKEAHKEAEEVCPVQIIHVEE